MVWKQLLVKRKCIVKYPNHEWISGKLPELTKSPEPVYLYFYKKYDQAMIVPVTNSDFTIVHEIINDGASAYKGIIPADRWHEPYMSAEELQAQIDDGVKFWGYLDNGKMIAVMGIQDKGDVTLIRHAYVRTTARNQGIGGKLLQHLSASVSTPILIGTWADATWAIAFYKKHGYRLVSFNEKEQLLRKYWNIPLRQIDTSVVLASANWVGV